MMGKAKSFLKLNSLTMSLMQRVKLKTMLHSLRICKETNLTLKCLIKNLIYYLKWTQITMTMTRISIVLTSTVRMLHSGADLSKMRVKIIHTNFQLIIRTQELKTRLYRPQPQLTKIKAQQAKIISKARLAEEVN